MNAETILKKGTYNDAGSVIVLTLTYPAQALVGYDNFGDGVYAHYEKMQRFYGVTKDECKQKAKKYLEGEKL